MAKFLRKLPHDLARKRAINDRSSPQRIATKGRRFTRNRSSVLVNRSSLLSRFCRQTKAFDSFVLAFESGSNVLAYDRPMLETMTRSSAHHPTNATIRMNIDYEI